MNSGDEQDWRIDWRTMLFTAVFFPLMIGLGFWQLSREQEKVDIQGQFEARKNLAPAVLSDTSKLPPFTPVSITGEFDQTRYWLLDNRIEGGRYGMEVMAVFRLTTGELVLVNRGWIAADPGRRALPDFDTPTGTVTALAEVRGDSSRGLVDEERSTETWPRIVQWLTVDNARAALAEEVWSSPVVLKAAQPGALTVRPPAVINMPPEKHRAYAVQWFALAATLLILVIWRARNAARRTTGND